MHSHVLFDGDSQRNAWIKWTNSSMMQ